MTEAEINKVLALNTHGRRNVAALVEPLSALPNVHAEVAGEVSGSSGAVPFWRFRFSGSNSEDAIRIGVFAAIHGDEPAGALAACEFLKRISAEPALAEYFVIHVYPVCNPFGYEMNCRNSRSGKDLNREFWKNSPEPEVQLLERELKSRHFHGLLQLHSDDTSNGMYGFVRGHVLTENLLRPALNAAGRMIPKNVNATIDGFAARDGIIFEQYEGILAAPPEVSPVPFEIVLETPHHAPMLLQVEAFHTALVTILEEYRRLFAFAADL